MKKAKIVLSAVALFAVVGGALAFKVSRGPATLYTIGANTFTTVPGGTTYYVCGLQPVSIPTNNAAIPTSLFYTSTTLLAGRTACLFPVTTRGTAIE